MQVGWAMEDAFASSGHVTVKKMQGLQVVARDVAGVVVRQKSAFPGRSGAARRDEEGSMSSVHCSSC